MSVSYMRTTVELSLVLSDACLVQDIGRAIAGWDHGWHLDPAPE